MLEAAREDRFSVYHSKGRLLVLPTKFYTLELFSYCQALSLVFVAGTDEKKKLMFVPGKPVEILRHLAKSRSNII